MHTRRTQNRWRRHRGPRAGGERLIAALATRTPNALARGARQCRARASGSLGRLTNARGSRSTSCGCSPRFSVARGRGRGKIPVGELRRRALAVPLSGAPSESVAPTRQRTGGARRSSSSNTRGAGARKRRARLAERRHERIGGADAAARERQTRFAALAMRAPNVFARGEQQRRAGAAESLGRLTNAHGSRSNEPGCTYQVAAGVDRDCRRRALAVPCPAPVAQTPRPAGRRGVDLRRQRTPRRCPRRRSRSPSRSSHADPRPRGA